ncbi:methyl-accepting chemotaxis protein [Chitinilyticum aquatile]|uniref:methyl-accepting chemotaxis protein n=1 Tax=Chitinilyticum aquatile TaxID=362520 RepID=UPI00040A72A8
MSWFRNMRVGGKLILAFLLLALIGAIIGVLGIRSAAQINGMTERIYEKDLLGINAIHEAKAAQLNVARAYRNIPLATSQAEKEAAQADLNRWRAELNQKMTEARTYYTTDKGKQMLSNYDTLVAEYNRNLDQLVPLLMQQPLYASSPASVMMNGDLDRNGKAVRQQIDELVDLKVNFAKGVFDEAVSLYGSARQTLIIIVVLGVALGIIMGFLIARSITRPLGRAVEVANALAAGDLSGHVEVSSRDETGQLLAAMQNMQDALKRIIGDAQGLVSAARQGDFSRSIDVKNHQGFAAELGQSLNDLSVTTDAGLKDVTRVANALAAGDLTQKIDRNYPGVFGEAAAGVNGTVTALSTVIGEIQGMVDAAANRGDFTRRLELSGKQGYTLTLAELLNKLSATTEEGLNDINRVSQALAAGDLGQKISKDYPGAFGQTRTAVNGIVLALNTTVDEIQQLVDAAANRGDFSNKLTLAGKQGYTLTLAELLNKLSATTEAGLNDVTRVAGALAEGDLTQRITAQYAGLFDQTAQGINGTVDHLKQLVGEIVQAASQINTAAGEIAEGNMDLSRRTESQAASLEETASSMEELTSTVKQNAENAQQANQFAIGAREVAGKGGAVVGQVVETMQSISDSSRKIVEIISVIDSIAFQTNILALNAAVEAARAGEQGRGFAVVASEVRTLAQRSASAAREIKGLIGDSVEKVDGGARLVNQAGSTMQEIETSVKRVTDIMAEISAASIEQSAGIAQVNQAVCQMDETTQQNAALVEEAAAAAGSLREQAQVLSRAIAAFKLDNVVSRSLPAAAQPVRSSSATTAAARPKPALAASGKKPAKPAPARGVTEHDEEAWEEF